MGRGKIWFCAHIFLVSKHVPSKSAPVAPKHKLPHHKLWLRRRRRGVTAAVQHGDGELVPTPADIPSSWTPKLAAELEFQQNKLRKRKLEESLQKAISKKRAPKAAAAKELARRRKSEKARGAKFRRDSRAASSYAPVLCYD